MRRTPTREAPSVPPVAAPTALAPGSAPPRGFVHDRIERSFHVAAPLAATWGWLCDPATFVDSQVWPWRVEFVDPRTGAPAGFGVGVLTTHHGPLMNFSGVITAVEDDYRDLQYSYGAYAISPRIARPTRLQFWARAVGDRATIVDLQVDAFVRTPLLRPWTLGNRLFWTRFGTWMSRSVTATSQP